MKKILILFIVFSILFVSSAYLKELNSKLVGKTIVIDVGHGGKDSGTTYDGVSEKDINLMIAKKLEKEINAVRFTHDEIMRERFGRCPDDFQAKYKLVDAEIRAKTKELVCGGKDVILDYGFWSKEVRKEYYNWGTDFAEDVVFCIVKCDLTEAKRRVLLRTKDNSEELFIDEDFFDAMAVKFEPFEEEEGYTFLYV